MQHIGKFSAALDAPLDWDRSVKISWKYPKGKGQQAKFQLPEKVILKFEFQHAFLSINVKNLSSHDTSTSLMWGNARKCAEWMKQSLFHPRTVNKLTCSGIATPSLDTWHSARTTCCDSSWTREWNGGLGQSTFSWFVRRMQGQVLKVQYGKPSGCVDFT